jgi:oligosaccharide repeat unit polymerase
MVLVFVFLAFFSLLLSRIFYNSYLSPVGLFGLIWNGFLALFELRLINYYPLSLEAYVAFIGSYGLFVAGSLLTTWPAVRRIQSAPGTAYKAPSAILLRPRTTRRLLDAMNTLGFLGLLAAVWRLSWLVGWGDVFNLDAVRSAAASGVAAETMGGGLLGYLASLIPLAAITAGVYWVYFPRDWKRMALCLAIPLGFAWITGNRTVFIWTSVLFFLSYALTRAFGNRESAFRLLRPVLLGVVLLFLVFGAIGVRRFDSSNLERYHLRLEIPWVFVHAYHYVTSGFGAFSIHLDDPANLPIPGAMTLSPVVRMLAKIDPALLGGYSYQTLLAYTVTRASVATPAPTNVFTYLGALFDDFGWWGVLLVPFIMGTIAGWLFQRLMLRPSFGAIALYAFFCLQFVYASTAIITHANSILVSMIVLALVQGLVSSGGKSVSRMLPAAGSSELSEQPLCSL